MTRQDIKYWVLFPIMISKAVVRIFREYTRFQKELGRIPTREEHDELVNEIGENIWKESGLD